MMISDQADGCLGFAGRPSQNPLIYRSHLRLGIIFSEIKD